MNIRFTWKEYLEPWLFCWCWNNPKHRRVCCLDRLNTWPAKGGLEATIEQSFHRMLFQQTLKSFYKRCRVNRSTKCESNRSLLKKIWTDEKNSVVHWTVLKLLAFVQMDSQIGTNSWERIVPQKWHHLWLNRESNIQY